MTTRYLLAEYARRMNEHGANSKEAREFLAENAANADFRDLAVLSRRLKLAITPRTRADSLRQNARKDQRAHD